MHYVFTFLTGLLVGKGWSKLGKSAARIGGGAAAKFDELYSVAGRKVGQRMEDIEDKIAEKRHSHTRT
jgi:hypothetical protein